MTKRYPLKPLRQFDYKLVEAKLDGLVINVDRHLQRRLDFAESRTTSREAGASAY